MCYPVPHVSGEWCAVQGADHADAPSTEAYPQGLDPWLWWSVHWPSWRVRLQWVSVYQGMPQTPPSLRCCPCAQPGLIVMHSYLYLSLTPVLRMKTKHSWLLCAHDTLSETALGERILVCFFSQTKLRQKRYMARPRCCHAASHPYF